jgi:sulfide:quinone oxidoreductase
MNKRIVIVGGGSGGITVAAHLNKQNLDASLTVIEPSENHYYQPYWTLAGAGVVSKESSRRREADVMPKNVHWIRSAVAEFMPEDNKVLLVNGESIQYDILVVASGLRLAWEKIKGVEGQLGTNGLCSIYEYDQVKATNSMIQKFDGGVAIFTMPPVPIKCAGAPQKIMYLAENVFRNRGVRSKARVIFATAGKAMFGIPVFSEALDKVVKKRGIETKFNHRLVEVRPETKTAIFESTGDGKSVLEEVSYDLLHVVPPMTAPFVVMNSTLAAQKGDQKGWLEVDKFTLQHKRFKNVFGIGDVTGVPNSKTGAAIRKQAPVVASNIKDQLSGSSLSASYNGYSSCPLITEIGKVILAEFGYDGKLMPSFPLDPAKPRRSMWFLKKTLLPILYWEGMLNGRA